MARLLTAGQGGLTARRAGLENGHMYWLSSTWLLHLGKKDFG